ncbi:MAG: D-alanyl-D-alanine carboxypeptidase family protein, partial [Clostridia bacterium]
FSLSIFAGAIEPINVNADAALLADPISGQILYAKNETKKAYPASLTKIMTALLVAEHGALDSKVTVTKSALQNLSDAGSTVGLKVGEVMTVDNLLICLMVASANEAANVLAEHVAGSVPAFVDKMNARAKELGCKNTHFANPHGLHQEDHYTCAYDMYVIARAATANPRLVEICNMQKATIPKTNTSPERFFFSTNLMLSPFKERTYIYKYTTGIKTGHTTQAGQCFVGSATKRDTSLLSVVLGARAGAKGEKNHFVETTRLFDWGFKNFKSASIITPEKPLAEIKVALAWDRDHVVAVPKESVQRLVPRDYDAEKLEVKTELPETLRAPIEKGAHLGKARLLYNGSEVATIELVAADAVSRSNILYAWDMICRFFGSTITKVVIVGIILLVIFYIVFAISYNKRRKNRRYRGRRR